MKKVSDQEKLQESVIDSDKYSYILDPNLSEYDKLAIFVNDRQGYEFTTGDQIKKFLMEEDL